MAEIPNGIFIFSDEEDAAILIIKVKLVKILDKLQINNEICRFC